MNHKDDVYVRSHYDGMTIALQDTPMPDEIAIIFCMASHGRLNARVGGLTHDEVVRRDNLKEPPMKTAVVNLGSIMSGDLKSPVIPGDTIITNEGLIVSAGTASSNAVENCDVVIDAGGAIAIPGLIDSHVHITFGDYTPRQKTVGFLESYVHGGVTTAISASEVHVPGRPKDVVGIKALAVAAHKCFETYRPGGMRVCAGSLILEPGLRETDFDDLVSSGVWMVKAGFGAFKTPFEYAPLVAMAKSRGMVSMVHTGGSSIPGSSGIWADHVLAINPDVSYHVNGGPVAMPDEDFPGSSTSPMSRCRFAPPEILEQRFSLRICCARQIATNVC